MRIASKLLLATFGALAVWAAIEPNASADTGSPKESQSASAAAAHEWASGTNLRMPSMNQARGRILFASKGCVICHSVNGIGGDRAPNLDAHAMPADMNPFEFAAKMWRGAAAMIAMQEEAFGGQIAFTGNELADLVAFAHSDEEQHKFSKADIPANILALMDHTRAVMGGASARTRKLGHRPVAAPASRLATAEPERFAISARQPIVGISKIPKTALPVEAITAKVIEAGFVHIHAIRFEDGRYKVGARNARGKNVVLFVDPISGAVRQVKFSAQSAPGSLLLVDAILKEVHGAGFRQISSISRRSMMYHVIARDPRDRVVKLFLHSKTGALIRHPTSGKPILKTMDGTDVSAHPAIESIVARVKAAGFAEVYSIEAEHGGFEVRVRAEDGSIALLYFDPATGELLLHP